MLYLTNLLRDTVVYVFETLAHNALSLSLGILAAAAIQVYINPDKFRQALLRRANVSIPGSVVFGAFTPFCACGTMAVIVSMLATALPWGPIMAFLTSSPLMSPDEFIMISGIIGPGFAIALTLASVIIGLASGYITHFIEKRSEFLKDQARISGSAGEETCGCGSGPTDCSYEGLQASEEVKEAAQKFACCSNEAALTVVPSLAVNLKLRKLYNALVDVGLKKVLLYFSIFAAIGYFINRFVPSTIIATLFNAHNILSVPLSAIIGLPLYVSGSSSIPIIKTLMEGGASGGAMLAFMITGPGTSAGVIAGIATIMKKRALALYVAYMLAGGIILGYAYDLFLLLVK